MMNTFILLPAARRAKPKAAVDLPLPSPVLTMIKPLRFLGSAGEDFLGLLKENYQYRASLYLKKMGAYNPDGGQRFHLSSSFIYLKL
jgi:hypothetical protein